MAHNSITYEYHEQNFLITPFFHRQFFLLNHICSFIHLLPKMNLFAVDCEWYEKRMKSTWKRWNISDGKIIAIHSLSACSRKFWLNFCIWVIKSPFLYGVSSSSRIFAHHWRKARPTKSLFNLCFIIISLHSAIVTGNLLSCDSCLKGSVLCISHLSSHFLWLGENNYFVPTTEKIRRIRLASVLYRIKEGQRRW